MPKEFTDCVNAGGKVITKQLKGNKYINICYDKKGKAYSGEVKTSKKKQKGGRKRYRKKGETRNLVDELNKLQQHWHDKYKMSG